MKREIASIILILVTIGCEVKTDKPKEGALRNDTVALKPVCDSNIEKDNTYWMIKDNWFHQAKPNKPSFKVIFWSAGNRVQFGDQTYDKVRLSNKNVEDSITIEMNTQ